MTQRPQSSFGSIARLVLALVLAIALVPGCSALISEAQANQMGVQAFQQIVTEAKVSTNTAQNELLRRVGTRIAAVVDRKMQEEGREPFQWEFVLIDEPTVNAFALPGGKVAFYTGILPICEDETGIAVVMGHEVAHAFLQHGRQRVARDVVVQYGLGAVQAVLQGTTENATVQNATVGALGLGTQLGGLYFSRDDESEADQEGLDYMAEAGYDPRAATAFWGRMDAASSGESPPELLSTHPHHGTRIERLEKHMPKALEIYERSK